MIDTIRSSRNILILAGVLLIAVLLTTGIVIAQRTAGVSDTAKELAGLEGIVHIVAEQSFGQFTGTAVSEAWVDAAGDRAKYVTFDADGNPVMEIVIDGTERTAYNFQDGVATKRVGTNPDDPILRSIIVDLWYFGAKYRLGQVEVLNEETEVRDDTALDGIPAIEVRASVSGPASSVVASLDRETLLPLEEEYYDSDGNVIASRSTRYSLVETFDVADPDMFVSFAGSDRVYEARTRMTVAQARDFQGFDIYYVGEAVDDRRVFWIQHDKRFGVYPEQIGLLNVVLVHYTPGGAAPSHGAESTTLVRTERATSEDMRGWEQKRREIHDGVVRELGETDFRLELLRGDVLVTLRASSEAQLAVMRSQLVKLN